MKKIIPIILLIFIYLSSPSQGTSVSESFINNLKLAHPVFNTKYNPQNRDLYFYSRLNNANTGFFVYDLDNEVVTNYIELDQPIGDLEYNPVQGHVLVSEFANESEVGANIRVFNANDNYNELSSINFSDENYPTEIYYAPNGKIYIALNMLSDEYSPVVEIISAKYYINEINEPLPSGFVEHYGNEGEDDQAHYSSIMHFSYNPYNESVYFIVGGNYSYFSPFQISNNNGVTPDDDVNVFPSGTKVGYLREITKYNELTGTLPSAIIPNPGEMICATPDNVPLNYQGKLYILGNNDQTYLYSYDCSTNELSEIDIPNVFDIDYNPTENCIYVYQYILNLNDNIPNESWIKILKVNNDNTIDETPLYNELGIASSITYNEYDNKLYLHYISDYRVMGHDPMQIIAIDVDNPANQDIYTSPNTCLFPEIISITNYPFFDPYTNKAYFPNGMQSSIGIFDFTPREKLPLVFGENKDLWMSVPRMENNMTDEYDEGDYVETVFDKGRFGIPYSTFDLKYENPENDVIEKASWYPLTEWEHDQEDNIFSYRGYIMELNSLEDNYLYMYGQIKDPATLFPIYPQKTNPIGYFLPQEQDVFDALGTTTLSLIDEIRSQNYYCEKQEGIIPYGPTGGNVGEIESYYWVCDKHQTNINYGDMIMVRSSQTGTEADEIQWQNGPGVVREKIRPKTEYFSYEQVNNYTPFIIELNYDVNPLELGAFINNKCVGATALMSEDSIVFMRVYLDGADPDSIVFQDWNGTKSSGNGIIREYKVFNELTKTYENRILKGNIGTNKVRISFKNANNNSNNDNEIKNNSFMIWPNPANNKLFFSIQIDESTLSKIELLDISGRKIDLIYSGLLKEGYNSGNINLSNLSIEAGIYFVKIKAGSLIQTKKLIINK